MKNNISKKIFVSLFAFIAMVACDPLEEDEFSLGTPPEASFAIEMTDGESNRVTLTSTASNAFIYKWDFGNGSTAEGKTVEAYYPFAGEFEVTLTVYGKGGDDEIKEAVTITSNDPEVCNIEDFLLLAGGCADEGKTWVFDQETPGHMGVGPIASKSPDWWQAPPNDKLGLGLYNDEMNFKLIGFNYDWNPDGDIFANAASAVDLGGEDSGEDQLITYTPEEGLTWSISQNGDGDKFLNLSNGSFMGFYTGVSTYEILTLEENELYVRFLDTKNPDLAWYHRLIPEGYTPPPPPASALPMDFESSEPPFTGFGGSTYAVIDNPDASGLNTSSKVGQLTKGAETWAGIEVDLDETIDFGTEGRGFKVKVWAPKTGEALFKIENADGDFVEVPSAITKTNEWHDVVFHFPEPVSGLYDKAVLFLDFGSTDTETFYFDDIELVPVATLPFDFETPGEPLLFGFGGSSYGIIDNPDATGINTSSQVGQTTKGAETWAGIASAQLDEKIDFSSITTFKMKVWAPKTGVVVLKLEDANDPGISTEVQATITQVNAWEELTFDFSGAPSGVYDRAAIFLDSGSTDTDTFYFDDLRQE